MNKHNTLFVSGISTEVGKTIASSILVEALEADYWKPVQAGELDFCDTQKVKGLISNSTSHFYPNAFALKTPMSPHAAAAIDEVEVRGEDIIRPITSNHLIIEGAGGLLVPINKEETILDLIQPEDKIVLVSRHYLGSINHTLLSIEALKNRGFNKIGIIFSGNEHPTTESIILHKSKVTFLGRIKEEESFTKAIIKSYAEDFKKEMHKFIEDHSV